MMRREGAYPYFRGGNFEAASLPYSDGDVSMYIFLPNRDSNLNEFLEGLNTENWKHWISQFHEKRSDMILPRFRLEYEVKLNHTLKALGMEIAFGQGANFSSMVSRGLFISEVRHKTLVEINEEGTEAAAVTMVTTPTSASLPFLVNRPFFFAIYDNRTKTILFMGIVREPM
jgi:serpin B